MHINKNIYNVSAGDFSPRSCGKTTAKLKKMGIRMTPRHRVGFASTRHQRKSATAFHRKKQSISGHTANSGVHLSNKLKRRISKSATVGRRKSSIGKSGHRFNIVTNTSLPGTAPALQPLIRNHLAQLGEADTSATQSIGSVVENSAVTQVHLRYKLPMATNQSKKQGEQLGTPDSHDSASDEQQKFQNESEQTGFSSTQSSQLFSARIVEAMKQISSKVIEEDHKLSDEQRNTDYQNIRELLERCRAAGDDDSDDDFEIPNLLDYDFHAIYKRDGLQFDEKWQDRMLERYLLLKLQKKQRQDAAMSKRIYLEQERHFRLLAAHPDLLQKYNKPWFEDPDVLANYILNGALSIRDAASPTLPPYSDLHSHHCDSRLLKRPTTIASSAQRDTQDGFSEKDGNFRFSIRPKSCDNIPDEKEHEKQILKQTKSSALSPEPPHNGSTALKLTSSSSTLQTLITDGPRPSTSIPGKTRYILIKPEKDRQLGKVVSPSKLEEQLLRRRFPSQHFTVMKSLGRIDEAPFQPQDFTEDDHRNESNNGAGTPVDEEAIQTVPFMYRKLQNMHKSDALSLDKTTFSGMLGKSDLLF